LIKGHSPFKGSGVKGSEKSKAMDQSWQIQAVLLAANCQRVGSESSASQQQATGVLPACHQYETGVVADNRREIHHRAWKCHG